MVPNSTSLSNNSACLDSFLLTGAVQFKMESHY